MNHKLEANEKGYVIVIGIIVLAAVFIGFMATTGFLALPGKPSIASAEVYPERVKLDDVLLITASVEDRQGVKSVEASVGNDNIALALIEGTESKGSWQGSWIVRSLPGTKEITITAVNILNKKSSMTVSYEVV